MGSHNVTCHPTQVNAPRLSPSGQAGWYSIYIDLPTLLGGMEGWVDLRAWLATYQDGLRLPASRQSPIQVVTAVFRSTISCFIPEIFVIKLPSYPKFSPNFDVFGQPNSSRRGPKFLTHFYKFGLPSNMYQHLVMINPANTEIGRWIKRNTSR